MSADPVPPATEIVFTVVGNAFSAPLIAPRVRINGREVLVRRHGTVAIPVSPGRWVVEAKVPWLGMSMGPAAVTVDVRPGERVPVSYAPPFINFAQGRMGTEPQERAGFVGLLVLLGLPVVLVVGTLVLLVLLLMLR